MRICIPLQTKELQNIAMIGYYSNHPNLCQQWGEAAEVLSAAPVAIDVQAGTIHSPAGLTLPVQKAAVPPKRRTSLGAQPVFIGVLDYNSWIMFDRPGFLGRQYFDHYVKGASAPAWMEKGVPDSTSD